jgi:diguanylate cyclase (GGDEF)-like protein
MSLFLALNLLYRVFKKDNDMLSKTKKIMKKAVDTLYLGYRITRGIDYKTLSAYILKINRYKDVNDILIEASRCLKDILDYELFGFVIKNGTSLELWVEPRVHTRLFIEFLRKDFNGQIIDCNVYGLDKKTGENCRNYDTIDMSNIIPYQVMENNFISRLYILPKRNLRKYYCTIVNAIIGSISIALENALHINQLKTAATVDPLTNCYNRRALDSLITSDIFYAKRYGTDLSVIMIDLDNFKKINDVNGHHAGDAVLQDICKLLPSLVRKSDYLARYGGDEFVLVLPDTTLSSAVQLAEKLRKRIEMHETRLSDNSIRVTASFGVASLENKPDGGGLLREADERLYKAKAIGKNCVVPSLLSCFDDRTFISKDSVHKYANAVRVA